MISKVKAIIFDFDGTLVDENNWIEQRWKKTVIFAENELDLKNFGKVFWERYYKKGPKYKYHVNETLTELDYSLEYLRKIVDNFLSEEVDEILMDGIVECLEILKDKYKLGILTNGKKEIQLRRIKNAGIFHYFNSIIYAFEDPKPSQIPYKNCLYKLGVEPQKAAYVGDDLSTDFHAPKRLGMISIYYNPENKNQKHDIDFQIKSSQELSNLLKGRK